MPTREKRHFRGEWRPIQGAAFRARAASGGGSKPLIRLANVAKLLLSGLSFLNEDTRWHGYERSGSELSLSPSHADRYYRAAEIVLDRAFPATPRESRTVRKTAAELRYGGGKAQQEALDRFGIKRPLRSLLFSDNVQSALAPH